MAPDYPWIHDEYLDDQPEPSDLIDTPHAPGDVPNDDPWGSP